MEGNCNEDNGDRGSGEKAGSETDNGDRGSGEKAGSKKDNGGETGGEKVCRDKSYRENRRREQRTESDETAANAVAGAAEENTKAYVSVCCIDMVRPASQYADFICYAP